QDLVAVVDQGLHRHLDQLGDAVAQVDVVHVELGEAPVRIVLHHGAARGQDAAGVAVAVRAGQVADDVLDQLLGGLEAEQRGVAGLLQGVGLLDDRTPDLVRDVGELAGLPVLHRRPSLRPPPYRGHYLVLPSADLESPTCCLDCGPCRAEATTSTAPSPAPSTPSASAGPSSSPANCSPGRAATPTSTPTCPGSAPTCSPPGCATWSGTAWWSAAGSPRTAPPPPTS